MHGCSDRNDIANVQAERGDGGAIVPRPGTKQSRLVRKQSAIKLLDEIIIKCCTAHCKFYTEVNLISSSTVDECMMQNED